MTAKEYRYIYITMMVIKIMAWCAAGIVGNIPLV
jgi:hypothetical protein